MRVSACVISIPERHRQTDGRTDRRIT